MRTALIGANGQLGTDLARSLRGEIASFQRPLLDVTDLASVERALAAVRPEVVVNAAALTHVDQCEKSPADAFAVNSLGARNVAIAAARVGARLAYVSTDYVYGASGAVREAYCEDDSPGPVNVYGVSKLAGEHFSLAECPRSLVIRTSGLYGHAGARGKGGNFVETMLRLGAQHGAVRVVSDQRLSPTSTADAARVIAELIGRGATGLFHVAASDHCTWFEFARAIFELAGVDVSAEPIPTSEYPLPARRPAMSALRSVRLQRVGVQPCRPWREQLADYLVGRRGSASVPEAAA